MTQSLLRVDNHQDGAGLSSARRTRHYCQTKHLDGSSWQGPQPRYLLPNLQIIVDPANKPDYDLITIFGCALWLTYNFEVQRWDVGISSYDGFWP